MFDDFDSFFGGDDPTMDMPHHDSYGLDDSSMVHGYDEGWHSDLHHEGDAGEDYLDHSGNGDLVMRYPDPLSHSGEYEMEPFDAGGHGQDDGTDVGDGPAVEAAGYTYDSAGGIMPEVPVNSLPGVSQGMLVNPGALPDLAAMGEIGGTHHVPADDIVRSESAKEDFLQENGYDSLPKGYEIHHIIPLSEGGADNPDNMILLRADQHAQVTDAHSLYYGWER